MNTITLVPAKIAIKAKQLYNQHKYENALELLEKNSFTFVIQDSSIKAELPPTVKKKLAGAAKVSHEEKLRNANLRI